MKINLKKVLLAGTAIVAMGTMVSSGEALAQCATSGAFAADCTFSSSDTEGAITLATGVDVVFSSAGNTININDTITGIATGDGTLATGGNGTIVYQSADIGVGGANEIGGLTIGSGDIWYLSANAIELSSGGIFAMNGGTLNFISGGATVSGPDATPMSMAFTGSSGVETINFASAASANAQGATENFIYASAFNLADGNDVINFTSGNGNILVNTFEMGAGNDTVTFNSGRIQSAGIVDFGTGNDTLTFNSSIALAVAGEAGVVEWTSFDMGTGDDSVTFNSSGSVNVGAGTFGMGAGTDTVTFNSTGGSITAATIDGGSGTDSLIFNSATVTFNSDVTGFETVALNQGSNLTLNNGGLASAAVTMGSDSVFSITGTSVDTISGTITGDDNIQTITLNNANATLSSTINFASGSDILNYTEGSLTGTVNFGGGADTLNIGGDVAITAAMSGLETIAVGANTLTLSAAITGVDDANDSGLDATGSTVLINSGGSVDGAIHGNAAGAVTFGADGNGGTFNLGGIVEDVQLFVSSGTLNTNGFALGANDPLARVIVGGGTFNVSDNITIANGGGAGDLVNSGTVTVDYDALIDVGDNGVSGGGTYNFVYFNSAGTEMIGGVTTTGAIDFTSASLNFSVAAGSGVVTTGTNVIQFASGGTADATGATVTDTSYLYNFAINDVGTELGLDITQSVALATATSNGNNLSVATTLLTDPDLVTTTDPEMRALQAAVSGASTQEEFNNALEQAQPTVDGSNFVAAMNMVNNSFSMMSDRMASLRTGDSVTGMTTGNISQGVRVWTQAFGATGNQDRRDGIDGYDFDTLGVAVGMDTENMVEDTVLGLAFSYADTDADSDNASRTSTQTDSYQFTVYGDHDFENNIYLNGMAAYTRNNSETSRLVVNSTANGEFDADQFTFRAEVGRDYSFETATLTPHVLGHWTRYDADSYTETGAGGAGLVVNQDATNIVELGLGVDASWIFHNADGSYFSPELSAEYRYDFAGDDVQMTSRYIAGGQAFTTNGFDAQQSTVNLGTGFTYYSTENWELTAEYDYEWKEDFDAHAGMFRAGYRF